MRHANCLRLAGALLAMGLLGAACGGASPQAAAGHSTTTTGHQPPAPTTSLPPMITTPTVTLDGHTYPVPREIPQRPIDPANDTGQQIVLSAKGFLPYHLFSSIGQPLVWTNLTSKPVRISFIGYPVSSGEIPPGGTFEHTFTTSYSFEYRSSTGYVGQVDVGAFAS